VKAAMRVAFSEFGLVVEPGGCVTLAAILAGHFPIMGKTVAITLTGRNVDPETVAPILATAA
jgi:threonine dehydratase